VTSLDGAAVRDIIKVLARRYHNLHLVIRPVRVQGEGAGSDIARGLSAIGRVAGVDVIIVARGGGSAEDLWAFNEEVVARAIAAAPVPVISAVGHEVDFTIADFVADLRAPTPSAAAEMVVARKDEYGARIERLERRAAAAVDARLQRLRARVQVISGRRGIAGWPARLALQGRHTAELSHELRRGMRGTIAAAERRFRELRLRLESRDPRRRVAETRGRLVRADGRLAAAATRFHHQRESRLRALAGRLDSLSPLAVLGRGYALCWDASKTRLLRDAATVPAGSTVEVTRRHM
jgi:exodeoxyribonuclease VII large subunit